MKKYVFVGLDKITEDFFSRLFNDYESACEFISDCKKLDVMSKETSDWFYEIFEINLDKD